MFCLCMYSLNHKLYLRSDNIFNHESATKTKFVDLEYHIKRYIMTISMSRSASSSFFLVVFSF